MELTERIALVERAVIDSLPSPPTPTDRRMIRLVVVAIAATFETYQVEEDAKS